MQTVLAFSSSLILILTVGNSLRAADIIVSSIADSGTGTLRQAVQIAATGDLIVFASSTDGRTILLESPITIDKSVTIQGNGSGLTILSGGNTSQVLSVSGVANLSLEDLSIVDGYHTGPGAAGLAIQSSNVTLRSITVEGNYSTGTEGGGISLDDRCNFSAYGVTVKHNVARAGGGIYVNGYSDSETIIAFDHSEISNNYSIAVSSSEGGGIRGYKCKLVLKNCTVSSNSVPHHDGSGGGIWTRSATVVLNQTSVSGNTAGDSNNAIRLVGPVVVLPN